MVDYSKWDNIDTSDDETEPLPVQPKSKPLEHAPSDPSTAAEDRQPSVEEFTRAIVNNQVLFRRLETLLNLSPANLPAQSIESLVALSCNRDEPTSSSAGAASYDAMVMNILVNAQSVDPRVYVENLREHKKKLGLVVTYYQHQLAHLQGRKIPVSEEVKIEENKEVKEDNKPVVSYPPISTSEKTSAATTVAKTLPCQSESSNSKSKSTFFDKFFAQMPQPYPQTLQFAQLPMDGSSFDVQRRFLTQYPFIITPNQIQAIIMAVFQLELQPGSSTSSVARAYIFNATLLEYAERLGNVDALFDSLSTEHGAPSILDDILTASKTTYDGVIKNCKLLVASAREEAAVAQSGKSEIQLYAVDPTSETPADVVVTSPQKSGLLSQVADKERYEATFNTLMRDAIEAEDLDMINQALATMDIEDAERAVRALDVWQVLSVEEKIYDATL